MSVLQITNNVPSTVRVHHSARLATLCIAVLAFGFAACSRPAGTPAVSTAPKTGWVDQERVLHQSDGDWLLNGRTHSQERFSPLTKINRTNVERLALAWEFRDFVVRGRTHRGMESNPIAVDGVLYLSGPWGVAYAIDARTGKSLWTFDSKADGNYGRSACCDVVNRGLAVWKGKVYTAALDGYLIAIDVKTGQQVWRVDTFIDRHANYTSTGAPCIAGDKILIGNAGGDMDSRGYVSAYDLETGKLAWRFFIVPGNPNNGPDETPDVTLARKTWASDTRWDLGGGGNAWDAMAYDPALNLVYVGTGNGGPHPRWIRSPGGGDNLFVSSIVALDVATGRMKWYYQETPGDSWDYAATSHMILADLQWNGQVRQVIMQAPKNGIFYVLDRRSGELLKADPFTTVNWTQGIDLKTGRPQFTAHGDYSKTPQIIWPSAAGGHAWQPMSYDPETQLAYLPVYDAPMKYTTVPVERFIPGVMNQGSSGQFPPYDAPADREQLKGQPEPKFEARLKAWNPITGQAAWISEPLPFVSGGILTTAGGLLFQGSTDGTLYARDPRTGTVLKRIEVGTAIMAAPITYELDGVQYVAVTAGAGGPQGPIFAPNVAGSKYQNFERLLVFKLDGGAVPLPPIVVPPERQPVPEPISARPQALARGDGLFRQHCQRCHLVGGASGIYPNLWNMPAGTLAIFDDIVYGGAYRAAGMASFADVLSKEDVQAIKAFIVNDWNTKAKQGEHAGATSITAYH